MYAIFTYFNEFILITVYSCSKDNKINLNVSNHYAIILQ